MVTLKVELNKNVILILSGIIIILFTGNNELIFKTFDYRFVDAIKLILYTIGIVMLGTGIYESIKTKSKL